MISPRVQCGAGTIWLPLKWGAFPSETKELVLYFGRFSEKTEGGSRKVVAPFAAVVTKIKPVVHGMAANTYPPGGEASWTTTANCQPRRKGQKYLIELFALDHRQRAVLQLPTERFATEIAEEALGVGKFAGDSDTETQLTEESLAAGHFIATYGPKPK